MNHYAYRIYKNTPNNPIVGGTVTAENLNDAANKIIQLNGVQAIHEFRHGFKYSHFEFKGYRVGILVYLNPEEF